jgi:hypothetical protein
MRSERHDNTLNQTQGESQRAASMQTAAGN